MAEVLITLAIIGVIAAIMIPNLIANHQKTTLETQFAKSYRNLSHIVNMAIAEHGDISSWDWNEGVYTAEEMNSFVKKYFMPNLNIVKFCPAEGEPGCFPNQAYTTIQGVTNKASFNYYNYTNCPKAILADGTMIRFNFISNKTMGRTLTFQIDINGNKKPNIVGRDLFYFSFYPYTNEFVPYGVYAYDAENISVIKLSKDEIKNWCINGAGDTKNGESCTALVVMDGFKMNY